MASSASVRDKPTTAEFGGTPYKPPIGYLTARERIEGREIRIVIVDAERASHVRWAFRAYASGKRLVRRVREGARGKRPVATPAPRPRAYLTAACPWGNAQHAAMPAKVS